MGYWNSRGLRGSELEEMINLTNELLKRQGLAIVQKIPTPIKPVEIDKEKRTITLAYFEQKSTVDYIGLVQGVPICFDAKETALSSFPISNIHNHQLEFMKQFTAHKGISFIILYYKKENRCFIIGLAELEDILERCKQKNKKSISIDDIHAEMEVEIQKGTYINYLHILKKLI